MRIKQFSPNNLVNVRAHVSPLVRSTVQPISSSNVRPDRSTFDFLHIRKNKREGVKTKKKFYGDKNRKTALTDLTALTSPLISNHHPATAYSGWGSGVRATC